MGVYSTSQFLGVAIGGSWAAGLTACLTVRAYFSLAQCGRSVAGSRQYHERTAVCQQLRIEIPANIAANEALKVRLLKLKASKKC